MPRYFFNVYDSTDIKDDVGSDLPSMDAVRREAVRTAGELLRDGGSVDLWSGEEWKMIVTDEAGDEVLALRRSPEASAEGGTPGHERGAATTNLPAPSCQ